MKKITVILIVAITGVWAAFSLLAPQAPLTDDLHLTYNYAGSTIRVTFSEISKNRFRAIVSPGKSEKIVNKQLKTNGGRVYEVESLGPLWIPPSSVKVGGHAHGENVAEVKRWKEWDVGVVKASFGVGGALRGEWYYDKNTGFLVGGSRSNPLSGRGDGIHFILIETNLENSLSR
jgi:hypothetical protein